MALGRWGGWRGLVWIDVDVKQFESQAACDSRIAQWLNHYPLLRQTFTERTHSGGWRFAVRVHEKTFTNFSLDGAGGRHMGEALGQGRFTVLAPTIGPSGNAYVNLNRAPPVWVERLDTVGLYPVSRRRGASQIVSRSSSESTKTCSAWSITARRPGHSESPVDSVWRKSPRVSLPLSDLCIAGVLWLGELGGSKQGADEWRCRGSGTTGGGKRWK